MATAQAASDRCLIAVCQMTSTHDLDDNFTAAESMLNRAKQRDAKMVFLPECFDFVGRNREENIALAMSEDSDIINRYKRLAKQLGLWLSLGGFHEKNPADAKKPYNTHLVIDAEGNTKARYHKLHLFDLDIPGKVRLMESEFSGAGHEMVGPVCTPVGNVALSICYDVRFAELALWNRRKGAHILTYPSAFTVNTGLAHWESLLRTRAIETQTYVVAAAQTGRHNEKRVSYGHAMVIDPWGAVIAQCSETVGMCFAEVSLNYLEEVRSTQPVFAHRRDDLYSVIVPEQVAIVAQSFGDAVISSDTIFYTTAHSFAFVNRSPVLPGHVLVCPIRKATRLTELSNEETADVFMTCRKVQQMLEAHHNTASSTVCVQDGPHAGQTVKHVHVHILPRKEDDFGGDPDAFYAQMEAHDKNKDSARKIRDQDDMSREAAIYRALMHA